MEGRWRLYLAYLPFLFVIPFGIAKSSTDRIAEHFGIAVPHWGLTFGGLFLLAVAAWFGIIQAWAWLDAAHKRRRARLRRMSRHA